MEVKRPFTDKDWEATPEPVRRYIIQLEDIVIKFFNETQDLKKRVSDLENKLNKISKTQANRHLPILRIKSLQNKPERANENGALKKGIRGTIKN